MRGFMGKEVATVIVDDNRLLSGKIAKLVREETEGWGWKMRTGGEMIGAEADRVVVLTTGAGCLEQISRARLSLGIILCCNRNERRRRFYNWYIPSFRAAVEEGLVEVATPPWHPQVR